VRTRCRHGGKGREGVLLEWTTHKKCAQKISLLLWRAVVQGEGQGAVWERGLRRARCLQQAPNLPSVASGTCPG